MTREEILRDYKVNEHGIICTPGKFEGEMLYAPYFYELMLDGEGEWVYTGSPDGCTEIEVTDEDRAEFPELDPSTKAVQVSENGQGFVHVEEV